MQSCGQFKTSAIKEISQSHLSLSSEAKIKQESKRIFIKTSACWNNMARYEYFVSEISHNTSYNDHVLVSRQKVGDFCSTSDTLDGLSIYTSKAIHSNAFGHIWKWSKAINLKTFQAAFTPIFRVIYLIEEQFGCPKN